MSSKPRTYTSRDGQARHISTLKKERKKERNVNNLIEEPNY